MIHLFHKVFISSDESIDVKNDKIIISENNARQDNFMFYEDMTQTKVLMYGRNFKVLELKPAEFFQKCLNHAVQTNNRLVIYTDSNAMVEVLAHYYSMVLVDDSKDNVKRIIKAQLFNYNMFNRSIQSQLGFSTSPNAEFTTLEMDAVLSRVYSERDQFSDYYINKLKSYQSLEFMLASYLYNGTYKEEFKNIFSKMYLNTINGVAYDIKEAVIINMMKPRFCEAIGLSQTYTTANLEDLESDRSKVGELLFKHPAWSSKYLTMDDTLNVTHIDDKFVNGMLDLADKISKYFTTLELSYDVNKLSMYGLLKDFKDEYIDEIVRMEDEDVTIENPFFCSWLRTVNAFIMNEVTSNKDNKDALKPFVIKS